MNEMRRFSNLCFFIGFGGNALREEVKKRAAWYVTDFQELIQALTITKSIGDKQ